MPELREPDKWENDCMDILGSMKAGNEQKWSARLVLSYRPVLHMLGEQYALTSCQSAYNTEEWRPSPARLRLIAARIASPVPTGDDAFAEVQHLAEKYGTWAKPTSRPNVFDEGVPRFSHGLVEKTVQQLGGWAAICTWNSKERGALDKQFREVYDRNTALWEQKVADALALPAPMRSQLLFPKWTPYNLPSGWTPPQEMLSLPSGDTHSESRESFQMPPRLREMLHGKIKQLPAIAEGEEVSR